MHTERHIQDYPKPHWGQFKRHTSQKITPLVHFYEKSAAIQKDDGLKPLKEPVEERLELEPAKEPSLLEERQDGLMTEKRKSQTCPNLSLCPPDRPLPPLPTERKQRRTRAIGKGQMGLKRTTTWIGLPVQRLLTSPPMQNLGGMVSKKYQSAAENIARLQTHLQTHLPRLHSLPTSHETSDGACANKDFVYKTDHDHCTFIRNQVQEHDSKERSMRALDKKIFVAPKRLLHCRVMQIINMGSDRECEYELSVYYNGREQSTQRGTLHKIDKNLSADRPQEDAVRFEIQEPFSLTFAVSARYTHTRLLDGLAKMGLVTPPPRPPAKSLSPAGFSVLTFEHKGDTRHQGITRFRLTKADEQRKAFSTWFHLELVVDMKVIEELPERVQKFPWAHALTEPVVTEGVQEDTIVQDPDQVQVALQHCVAGDYLTLYTRGMAHPAWKRYWASLEGTNLVLYDFTYKTSREPLSTVSLRPLRWVGKPSMDDCEQVGIARRMGIMLQFDRRKAVLTEDVHFDEGEILEGKAFFYCDHEINATHWRQALTAHVANTVKSDENEGGVDLRFLW